MIKNTYNTIAGVDASQNVHNFDLGLGIEESRAIYGDIIAIHARGGVGKSTLCLRMMVALNKEAKKQDVVRPVLYISYEDTKLTIAKRAKSVDGIYDDNIHIQSMHDSEHLEALLERKGSAGAMHRLVAISKTTHLSLSATELDSGIAREGESERGDSIIEAKGFLEYIQNKKDEYFAIVVDPLYSFAPEGVETSNDVAGRTMAYIRANFVPKNGVFAFIHHERKGGANDGIDGMRGSSALGDGARLAFGMKELDAVEEVVRDFKIPPVQKSGIYATKKALFASVTQAGLASPSIIDIKPSEQITGLIEVETTKANGTGKGLICFLRLIDEGGGIRFVDFEDITIAHEGGRPVFKESTGLAKEDNAHLAYKAIYQEGVRIAKVHDLIEEKEQQKPTGKVPKIINNSNETQEREKHTKLEDFKG